MKSKQNWEWIFISNYVLYIKLTPLEALGVSERCQGFAFLRQDKIFYGLSRQSLTERSTWLLLFVSSAEAVKIILKTIG